MMRARHARELRARPESSSVITPPSCGGFCGRPRSVAFVALAAAMHAAGHALVALVAGGMAVALARMWGMRGPQSSPLGDDGSLRTRAFLLAAVGLGVLVVKGARGGLRHVRSGPRRGRGGRPGCGSSCSMRYWPSPLASPTTGRSGGAPPLAPPTPAGRRCRRSRSESTRSRWGSSRDAGGAARGGAAASRWRWCSSSFLLRMAAVASVVLGVFGALLGEYQRRLPAGDLARGARARAARSRRPTRRCVMPSSGSATGQRRRRGRGSVSWGRRSRGGRRGCGRGRRR